MINSVDSNNFKKVNYCLTSDDILQILNNNYNYEFTLSQIRYYLNALHVSCKPVLVKHTILVYYPELAVDVLLKYFETNINKLDKLELYNDISITEFYADKYSFKVNNGFRSIPVKKSNYLAINYTPQDVVLNVKAFKCNSLCELLETSMNYATKRKYKAIKEVQHSRFCLYKKDYVFGLATFIV